MQEAVEKGSTMGGLKQEQGEVKNLTQLMGRYKSAKALETRYWNSQMDTAKDSELYSSEKYIQFAKEFGERKKQLKWHKGA